MKILSAFYDFSVAPASYDFVTFLTMAEMARVRGKYDHMRVVFVPADTKSKFREDMKPIDTPQKAWRHTNMLVPMCSLVGASVVMLPERAAAFPVEHTYPVGYTIDQPVGAYWMPNLKRAAALQPLPQYQVDPEATKYVKHWVGDRPYLTITHRNTYGEARNSNRVEWSKFIHWAERKDWKVIQVPDIDDAGHWYSQTTGGIAAVNPVIRFALYANAAMNLGVNAGPMMLCWQGGLPHLTFKMVADYYSTTPQFFEKVGMPVGSQLPWFNEKQRFVWSDDTFATIRDSFVQMMEPEQQEVA